MSPDNLKNISPGGTSGLCEDYCASLNLRGFVGTADGSAVRSLLQDPGILGGLGRDLVHHVDERVDGLLGFGFRGLDHQRLVEQEREIDGRRMEAEVQQALRHVERGGAVDVVVGPVVDECTRPSGIP